MTLTKSASVCATGSCSSDCQEEGKSADSLRSGAFEGRRGAHVALRGRRRRRCRSHLADPQPELERLRDRKLQFGLPGGRQVSRLAQIRSSKRGKLNVNAGALRQGHSQAHQGSAGAFEGRRGAHVALRGRQVSRLAQIRSSKRGKLNVPRCPRQTCAADQGRRGSRSVSSRTATTCSTTTSFSTCCRRSPASTLPAASRKTLQMGSGSSAWKMADDR
jgi:hypothetical protein